MRIQIPGWRDDAPLIVPVELENRASFDLTSGHLRATLAREEETATVTLELEILGGQRVLTVGLPAFSGALAARVLEGLGFHWSSAPGQGDGPWWNEVRHDSTGVVAWLRSAYILRLTSHPFVLDLLQRSGWPIEQGIGGSMVLAMRLAVLHDRYANAERARALTGLEHEIATADVLVHYQGRPSASGVLVDPGPRDYSGDRGPAPEVVVSTPGADWEDSLAALTEQARTIREIPAPAPGELLLTDYRPDTLDRARPAGEPVFLDVDEPTEVDTATVVEDKCTIPSRRWIPHGAPCGTPLDADGTCPDEQMHA